MNIIFAFAFAFAFAIAISLILALISILVVKPNLAQSQIGGSGNEITKRYFAKYYVKVLIDYLNSKVPDQTVSDTDINKIHKQSKNTTTVLPLIKQLLIDFPTIDITSSKFMKTGKSSYYFYQISNRLDIKQYYRDPIVSTFKPVLYIEITDRVIRAGFLDVPQFRSVSGFDNCNIGYSASNNENRIIHEPKKQVKNRLKHIFVNTTSSCITDRSRNTELNEIDCILTGFSWNRPKYY